MFFEYLFFLIKIFTKVILGVFIKYDLAQENAILLKENQILKQKNKKPRLTNLDRLFYLTIYHSSQKLLDKIVIIKTETILKWHQKLVQRKWDYSLNKKTFGRPPITDEIKSLIIEMKINNPLLGI